MFAFVVLGFSSAVRNQETGWTESHRKQGPWASRPQPRPHSFWPRPRSRLHGIWPRPHRNWPRGSNIYSAHDINWYSQNSHRQSFMLCIGCLLKTMFWTPISWPRGHMGPAFCHFLSISVFTLIHTELFSNVSGLGLIHCGLGSASKKNLGPRPRPHSFWPRPRPWPHAQLASLTSLTERTSSVSSRIIIAPFYTQFCWY